MTYPTFTNGTVLPASDLNAIGLWEISSTNITAGVSSVTVSGFSADYDSYRIEINNGSLAGLAVIQVQMFGSVASYYGGLAGVTAAGAFVGVGNNNVGAWSIVGVGNTNYVSLAFDLHDPFIAKPTRIGPSNYASTTDFGTYNGLHNVATSYSAVTLSTGSTFQSGTVRLYGYQK